MGSIMFGNVGGWSGRGFVYDENEWGLVVKV